MRLRSILSLFVAAFLLVPMPLQAKKDRKKAAGLSGLENCLKMISFPEGDLSLNYSPSRDGAPFCRKEMAVLDPYWSMFLKGKIGTASLSNVGIAVEKNAAAKRSIDSAKKCLNRSESENNTRVSLDAGFLSLLQGEYAEAIGNFNDVLKIEPLSELAVNGSVAALMLQWKELSDDQRIDWSKQIAGRLGERMRGAGGNAKADEFLRAAHLYYLSESLSPAMVYIESGLKLYPENPSMLLGRALIWARGGEYDEALKDIEMVAGMRGVDTIIVESALRLKRLCLAAKGTVEEAKELLQGLSCGDLNRSEPPMPE